MLRHQYRVRFSTSRRRTWPPKWWSWPHCRAHAFGSDTPAALEQTVQINHLPFRVIGVMATSPTPRMRDFQIQSLGSRLQSFNQIVSILVLFTPAVRHPRTVPPRSTVLAGCGGLIGVGAGIGLSLLMQRIAPAIDPALGAPKLMISMLSNLLADGTTSPPAPPVARFAAGRGAISGPPLRDFPGTGGDDRLWRDQGPVGGRSSADPVRR